MSTMEDLKEQATAFIKQRTSRERILGGAGIAVALLLGLYTFIISPALNAFTKQSQEAAALKNLYSVTPDILARYSKLVARRKEVEDFYEKVDLRSPPFAHLEKLLLDKVKLKVGEYQVDARAGEGSQLGGKYTHKVFGVSFPTSSLEDLATFLKELTSGEQPMLVSQINISKSPRADSLNVKLEVSGFEEANK